MQNDNTLAGKLTARFGDSLASCIEATHGEVTIVVASADIVEILSALRDEPEFAFEQLIDLCGVDYLTYGETEWQTQAATEQGFSRGRIKAQDTRHSLKQPRFAVIYHLLSYKNNQRLRVRTFVDDELPLLSSVASIWNAANWYEREAFDLFGIVFEGHPDLRRLLTDYGFIGHPFRKDFPISGYVEMRYDETKRRVVYEPVKIEPRVLVPRVIRDDHRYVSPEKKERSRG